MLRFLRPERLLSVESLPDITAFFATLQSPVTPLLPSFWAGETLFAAAAGRASTGSTSGALWTTALASIVLARIAFGRSTSRAGARRRKRARPASRASRFLDRLARALPAPARPRGTCS